MKAKPIGVEATEEGTFKLEFELDTANEFYEAQSRLVAMARRAIEFESRIAELERTIRYVEAERDVLMRCTNQPTDAVTEAARIEVELRGQEARVSELEATLRAITSERRADGERVGEAETSLLLAKGRVAELEAELVDVRGLLAKFMRGEADV
jgi:chromosome segregation ATPase